ncbi:HNH endonuclease [Aestuariibaculum sp. M13]|uniref:YDG/SRA domain-containing protein n=1 Tax=Aestuariibaculum sp. M13 TaxID=2967132 RepID=UPI002159E3DD|nr:YDG/SRA domain-containing protein [Aestuariibaculum sp. M13]MCR8666239.1 HNH endonuclease [Aestuariibaculum sp. M13]
MARPIIFGEIEGFEEGYLFKDRKEMMPNSFHRVWSRGIDSDKDEGASAVVLSGEYKDEDNADAIIYTGAGGRDKKGKQIKDQDWFHNDNIGLMLSCDLGKPVRVIIGHKHKSPLSPKSGYVYAGLYYVDSYWNKIETFDDKEFKMCKFKLIYIGNNKNRSTPEQIQLDHSIRDKKRVQNTVMRLVRDSQISLKVKELYDFKCQVCGIAIETKSGFYAEGAHIKALGKPHNGDDSLSNLICLCPNHHVMFDKGVFSIMDNYELIGVEKGQLTVDDKHKIDKDNLKYHRSCHGYN